MSFKKAVFVLASVAAVTAASACSSSDSDPKSGATQAALCPSKVAASPGTVITDKGAVVGEAVGNAYRYLGIPYAQPPVGDLRWKPPQDTACFKDPFQAKQFGAVCVQPNIANTAEIIGNEDCLSINVWAPKTAAPGTKLPIMFWIHGGGNNYGGSGELDFIGKSRQWDGQALAEKGNVIIVTFNYRLGVLGYLTHPELAAESADKVSGNYGMLDAVSALSWVKRNADAFGGDASKVTVFGESAGAINSCMLLTMPKAAGLFNQMILESASPCKAETLEDESKLGVDAITAAGCPTTGSVPCMRNLPAEQIVRAYPGLLDIGKALSGRFPPIMQAALDGKYIPEQPMDAIFAGRHNKVALIVGSNADETRMFIQPGLDDAQYRATCEEIAEQGNGVFLYYLYPPAKYETPTKALGQLTTDAGFLCSARRAAKRMHDHQTQTVYRYQFAHAYAGTGTYLPGQAGPLTKNPVFGAFHTSELPYVFGNLTLNGYMPTAGEIALSDQMMGYWLRFAKTGNPNGDGAPVWDAYDPAKDNYIVLDDPISTGAKSQPTECDFWDTIF